MSSKAQAALQTQLQNELTKPENQVCADCNQRGPRWASYNLGIFLCMPCAGIHRNLGTHVSRVKSVTLDNWKTEEVETMKANGNKISNDMYQSTLPHQYIKKDQTDFIKKKYVKKEWAKAGAKPHAVVPKVTPGSLEDKYSHQLTTLHGMGFTNNGDNVAALERARGDLNIALEVLVKMADSQEKSNPTDLSGKFAGQVEQLKGMGFSDKNTAQMALERTNGNIEQAIELLVQQGANKPPQQQQSQQQPSQQQQNSDPFASTGSSGSMTSSDPWGSPASSQPFTGNTAQPFSYGAAAPQQQQQQQPQQQPQQQSASWGASDPFGSSQPQPQSNPSSQDIFGSQTKQPESKNSKADIMSLFNDTQAPQVQQPNNPYAAFHHQSASPMNTVGGYNTNMMGMGGMGGMGGYGAPQQQQQPMGGYGQPQQPMMGGYGQPQMGGQMNTMGGYPMGNMGMGNPASNGSMGGMPQQQFPQASTNPFGSSPSFGQQSQPSSNNNSTNPFAF